MEYLITTKNGITKWCTFLNNDTIFHWSAETKDGHFVACSWQDNEDYSLLYLTDDIIVTDIDIGVWFVRLAGEHTQQELLEPFKNNEQYFLGKKIRRKKAKTSLW